MLCTAIVLFAFSAAALADEASGTIMVFDKFLRLSHKPVLTPRKGKFDSAGAFNPGCTKLPDGRTIMLYRAQDNAGVSRIGLAESTDGIHFEVHAEPVLSPSLPDESKGIEDPRLCASLENPSQWFLTATAYNKDAQLALYKSSDLYHWERVGIIMPAGKGKWNINWTKSGAIVPQKINGKFWMYYLGDTPDGCNQTGLACSFDGIHWEDATERPVLPVRSNMFDSQVVEPGPAPLITDDGILLLYNGADKNLRYQIGWALFDKSNPSRLIARSDSPIFSPEESWELKNASKEVHQAPNVVFAEGLVRDNDRFLIYYGAADSYVGVAETKLVPYKIK